MLLGEFVNNVNLFLKKSRKILPTIKMTHKKFPKKMSLSNAQTVIFANMITSLKHAMGNSNSTCDCLESSSESYRACLTGSDSKLLLERGRKRFVLSYFHALCSLVLFQFSVSHSPNQTTRHFCTNCFNLAVCRKFLLYISKCFSKILSRNSMLDSSYARSIEYKLVHNASNVFKSLKNLCSQTVMR